MEKIWIDDKQFQVCKTNAELNKDIQVVVEKLKADLSDKDPLFICVLNGAFVFFADLFKQLDFSWRVEFVKVASYSGIHSEGKLTKELWLKEPEILKDRTVVIVEDIVDSGLTMSYLIEALKDYQPKEVLVCTQFVKRAAITHPVPLDYVATEMPNDFIVGYGLDYNGKGRHLKDLYELCK